MSKKIRWDAEKAKKLRENKTRGSVSFEECAVLIEGGDILDIIKTPSLNFPNQRSYILNIEGYAYLVPFVENDDEIFLKTMYPNRKLTAFYLDKKTP